MNITEIEDEVWDRQIADDLRYGRLDAVLADVNSEIDAWIAKPQIENSPPN